VPSHRVKVPNKTALSRRPWRLPYAEYENGIMYFDYSG
jgi:hypothetical protein